MLIPVKCFTCGCVLADKFQYFQSEVRKMKKLTDTNPDKVSYFTQKNMDKTPEGIVLDNLRLYNVCCRRHMLTHVDIE
jgi:DNA-directed RNA polymerase subunit N (RpoN/RPB10)